VGFVRALLGDLSRHVTYDPRRVYATGLSNGAMMAYRLAIEASDLVTAIAPVAGAMRFPGQSPGRPVPVLHFHSVDDPRAHYEGGPGALIPGTEIAPSFRRWMTSSATGVAYDGCPWEPAVGSAAKSPMTA
jgi:polyhydroxybutyrate depolymerase